ncbi:MAG: tRNA (adenine-N1)-methyltransferase [Leptospirales bacterium]
MQFKKPPIIPENPYILVSWNNPPYNPGMSFLPGEPLILYDSRGRSYYISELKPGKTTNIDGHKIPHDLLIAEGMEGTPVPADDAKGFTPFRPTLRETLTHLKRRTQVIYPKDQGIILMWGDILPGHRVLESGIGSGAMTISLLRMTAPGGKVVSVEKRPEHAEEAMKNLGRLVPEYLPAHKLLIGEIGDPEIPGRLGPDLFDRILLDLPEPWAAIPHLPSVLRPGGLLLSWVPTPLQVHTLSLKLKDSGIFHLVQTVETIVRDWEFGPTSVRPAHRIIGHTGYLTVARKSAQGLPYIPWEPPF